MHVTHYVILTDIRCPRGVEVSSCPLTKYMNSQEAVSLLVASKTDNFVDMDGDINFFHILNKDAQKAAQISAIQGQMKAICAQCKENNKGR